MRTQGDLLAEVRELADDPTPHPTGRYRDSEIRRWLNNGAREVARQTQCLRDKTSVNAVGGQTNYVLSGALNIIGIHKVEYRNGPQTFTLDYRDQYNADRERGVWREQGGFQPRIWTTWDTPPSLTLEVFPAPATTTGTFDIYFYRHPTDLITANADDAAEPIDLPSGWEEAPVLFALARAAMKDRNPPLYEQYMAEFANKVQSLAVVAGRFTDQGGGGIILRDSMEEHWGWSY